MNITEEKTGELTATLKLEVNEADYAEAFDRELKNYRRQASMPGFRPGKVPMGLIRKKYGTAIMLEEVNKLVSEKLNEYIKDNKLDLLGYPLSNAEKEPQDFARQKDFNFYFDIGYAPQVDINLSEFEAVDYLKIKVDDEKLDEQIREIRNRNGKLEEVDEVKDTDNIHVKINELGEDGKIVENGISNETMILVSFIKDEDTRDQVIGSKVGDVVIFNPLKATGSTAETTSMLGIAKEESEKADRDFQFEITKIERNMPAELNEELFKATFPNDEIKTEEEFRGKVKDEMSKIYEAESDRLLSRMAMDAIFEKTEVNLPDEFLQNWLHVSNDGKISLEEIKKHYDEYRKSMKMELIESKLIKENENLRVSDEDIKAEIKRYFRGYFLPGGNDEAEDDAMSQQLEQLANNYLEKNKEETRRIHDDLFNRRLSELLKEKMTLVEKEVTYDEFMDEISKLNKHDHDHDHDHDHHHHDHEHHDHDHDHEAEQGADSEKE